MTNARFETLEQWLRWQEKLHVREIDLGLERSRRVADGLGLGKPPFKVITVAGTNGKGSCVAMLCATLIAAGYRVASYTSPHLLRYNERIQINRQPLGDELICGAFARIDAARGDIPLTYFEFGTLAALDLFYRERPEIVVLEVGLGGRLDAVNIMDADCALLTAIDLDHVEFLGPDRESIGREKAGVFRAGKPAVCSDPRPPASVALEASRLGARLHQLGVAFDYEVSANGWTWFSQEGRRIELPPLGLAGHFQLQNAAGVIRVLDLLRPEIAVDDDTIVKGLSTVSLPGRFQRAIYHDLPVILDVAHNPHAAAALARNLMESRDAGTTRAVFGMLRDKDAVGVIEQLAPFVDEWYPVSLGGPRGTGAQVLVAALEACGIRECVHPCTDVGAAMDLAVSRSAAGDRLLVFGSFLTVSGAQSMLAPAQPRSA